MVACQNTLKNDRTSSPAALLALRVKIQRGFTIAYVTILQFAHVIAILIGNLKLARGCHRRDHTHISCEIILTEVDN